MMIFTQKGFLGNKIIEEAYVLSILIDQTYFPNELVELKKQIENKKCEKVIGDEIFIKASELKKLQSKKEIIESKYKGIREKCKKRIDSLEKTFTWKVFYNLFLFVDYIFNGYTYPRPFRTILSNQSFISRTLQSHYAISSFSNIQERYGEKTWLQSKKLCEAIYKNKLVDYDFLMEIGINLEDPKHDKFISPLDLNKFIMKNPEATFLVRAKGGSMSKSGITDQSVLVVDRCFKPSHNDIVVASMAGEFTCKRLKLKPRKCFVSDDPKYPPVFFNRISDIEIIGTVTTIINQL